MLLVIASAYDERAKQFAGEWNGRETVLVTPAGFCSSKWRIDCSQLGRSVIGSDGKAIRLSDVTGVISVLPSVNVTELPSVHQEDRLYACMEISALLTYLLNQIPALTINRPSPYLLNGPAWSYQEWLLRAAQCSLVLRPTGHSSYPNGGNTDHHVTTTSLTWLHDSLIEEEEFPTYAFAMRKLAQKAKCEFLQLFLRPESEGSALARVNFIPDLSSPIIRAKLAHIFVEL